MKNCEWCGLGYRFEFNMIDGEGHTITNDNIVVGGIARFCPHCGKKLDSEVQDENMV